jgi:hypothetical protein
MNSIRKLAAAGAVLSAVTLPGCYVVPTVDPQGNVQYYHYPLPPSGTPAGAAYPAGHPAPPVSIPARLYPDNELANQSGMIVGTVTNMRTGKGRFQLQYRNEVLTGEATRHGNDDKSGVASAYGNNGTFMQCEYRMNTPVQGAGTCTFSTGARYKLHLGS